MKKFTILMVLLFISMTCIMAQAVSDYTFSTATNGSLEDMSTGTTNILGPGTYYDSGASTVANIGFTFTFAGTAYTQFSANSNGLMRLGSTVVSTYGTGASSATTLLGPLAGDNSIQINGKIHYKVIGALAPRKLVVEWQNMRVNYGTGTTDTYCTMQAWLYETSNRIDFVYGTMYNMSTSAQTRAAFISTSSTTGSICSVATITTTPTWVKTGTSAVTTSFAASSSMTNLNSAADGSRRVFTFLPPDPLALPNAAISPSPADVATGVSINPTLTWASGGGVPTGYKVYFATAAAGLPGTPNATVTTPLSYTPAGPLAYNTSYVWKIVPYNANGDCTTGMVTWGFTTMLDPTQPLPYTQNFNSGTSLSAINWTGDMSILSTHGNGATNGLYKNLYSSTTTTNVVSCPIGPMVANAELKFDYRIVNYSGYPATGTTIGASDKIEAQISTDGGSTFTTVYTINQANHVTSTAFATITVPLSAYSTGNIKVKLLGTWGAGDYYLDIDNVIVRETPASPIFTLTPSVSSWDFGQTVINTAATKQFTIANTGAGTLNISSVVASGAYYSISVPPTDMALTTGESTTFTVQYLPTTVVGIPHTGTVTITDGRTVTTITLSGSCVDPTILAASLPSTQNFDAVTVIVPALPLGWTKKVTDVSGYGYVQTVITGYSTPNRVALYNSSDSASDLILITPLIVPALNTLRVKFMAYGGTGYTLQVGTVDVPGQSATFTSLQTVNISTAAWAQYSVNLSAYAGSSHYIAFRHGQGSTYQTIYLDDIVIEVPAAIAPEAATAAYPANADLALMGPTLKWTPSVNGEPATGYKVYMNTTSTFTEANVVYNGLNTTFPTTTTAYDQQYFWKVVPYNANGSTLGCPTWSFTIVSSAQLAEGFEGTTFPPVGWTAENYWYSSTSYAYEGTKACYRSTGATAVRLVTPYLNLTGSSTLKFKTYVATATLQKIQLSYFDGTVWANVGEEISLIPGAWQSHSVDVSILGNNSYKLGIGSYYGTGGVSASVYLDLVIGPIPTPFVPNPVTQTAPADLAINQSNRPTLTWTAPTTGGVPQGYRILCDGTNPPTTILATASASPYTLTTDLTWGNTYYWSVVPYNTVGDATPNTVRSFTVMADPTQPLPYTQNFNSGTSLSAINWTGDMSISSTHGNGATNGLYKNLYSSATTTNVVSCPIGPMVANAELKFDYRIVNYSGYPATGTTIGASDKIEAQISTDGGSTFTTVYTINQANHVTSTAFATITVPLSAYSTGNIKVKLLGTWSAGDYYLDIDNVIVRETPASPIFSLTPSGSSWAFGDRMINTAATKQFTITNSGGGTINISSVAASGTYYSISVAPTDLALDAGESTNFTVQYLPTSIVGNPHTGSITITDDLTPSTVVSLSGSCVDPTIYAASLPRTQNFDSVTVPALPLGWTKRVTDTSTYGYVQTTTGGNSAFNRVAFDNSSDSASDLILITPLIDSAVNINTLRVRFKAIGGAGYTLQVGTVDVAGQNAVFTLMQAVTITASWAEYTVPFNTYAGTSHYLAFRHGQGGTYRTSYLDDVVVETIPTTPILGYTPATIAFGTALATNPTAYQNVTVTNNGEGTLNLTAADISLIGTDPTEFGFTTTTGFPAALTAGQSVTIPVRFAPTTVGAKTATLRIVYDAANYDVALTGNALPETALFEGFEGTTFPPADWTVTAADAGGTQTWTRLTTGQRTGVACASIGYESAAHDDWLITPKLAITASDYTFSFWAMNSGTYFQEKFNVLVSTLTNGVADFTNVIATGVAPGAAYSLYSYDLSAFAGSNVYVGIQATETNQLRMWIDDVTGPSRYLAAGVPNPVTLTAPANGATGLAKTGFNFTWTADQNGGTPTSYIVYMATDESTMFEENSWTTTNTHFNPVTEGLFTFDYLGYYLWTVKATNTDGSATADPVWSFEIQDDPFTPVTTFPWSENFDAALTVPTGWVMSDVDAGGTSWVGSASYSHSAPNSFKHGYSTAVVDPGQDGWMITRPVTVPATGTYALSWWNYNSFADWMVYNGVLVNTTNDPTDLNWVELWSQASPASVWSNAVVTLDAYAGQTVYFAFNYQGYDGDDWYIDDVSVSELTVDLMPPTITHLPVLNTPRTDITYTVFAEIADDATWNNPIGGAELYYSIDATNFTMVAMVYETDGYYASIPAQILGTTVTYKIKAWDSENNEVTTDDFSFTVANPTWVWYDQGGTSYIGYNTTDYGPTVFYANPFYGTGIPMVLNSTDGETSTAVSANLHVYSYDGTDQIDITGAIPVAFAAQTHRTVDLTSYNINITTPYFLVAYQDIPMGNFFLFDDTYDYGTSYVYQGTTLYTMSNSGSWAIGVNITNGLANLDAPVVTITKGVTGPTLNWAAVTNANSYIVYGSANPYAADPWTLVTTTSLLTHPYAGVEKLRFFKVVASSANLTKKEVATRVNNLVNNGSRHATPAPKGTLNLKNRK